MYLDVDQPFVLAEDMTLEVVLIYSCFTLRRDAAPKVTKVMVVAMAAGLRPVSWDRDGGYGSAVIGENLKEVQGYRLAAPTRTPPVQ